MLVRPAARSSFPSLSLFSDVDTVWDEQRSSWHDLAQTLRPAPQRPARFDTLHPVPHDDGHVPEMPRDDAGRRPVWCSGQALAPTQTARHKRLLVQSCLRAFPSPPYLASLEHACWVKGARARAVAAGLKLAFL
eukprot:767446-Hanusia_phi.AAC.4